MGMGMRRGAAAPEEAPSSLPASLAADAPTQYEYLDHTADVQLHSWGATLEDAFAQQVLAMMGLMTELPTVEPSAVREVTAEGHDLHSLLFHLLDEFLFLFSTELFVACRVAVAHSASTLRCCRSRGPRTARTRGCLWC